MTPELVTVGGLTVDNVIAADGTVALACSGGNGAYSAVGALMWRQRVGLVSHAVASYPRDTLEALEESGIDFAGVRWSNTALSACNWFIYDAQGRREENLTSPPDALAAAGFPTDRLTPPDVTRWREALAARTVAGEVSYSEFRTAHPLTADQIPDDWLATRGVHLAPSQPDVMHAMLDRFNTRDLLVTADPGWQLAARSLDEIAPILARLDAFLPSEVELNALVPGASLSDALAAIAALTRGTVAVKRGGDGVLVWDRATRTPITVPAINVAACDPTGAGDSFCGGFLAGLVDTGDPIRAAHCGALSASRVVQHFGADGALAGGDIALCPPIEATP